MTAHHNDWDTSARRSESSSSITSSSDTEIAALKAEMAGINKNLMRVLQVNQQVKAVTPNYETYGGPHSFNDCPSTVGNTQNVYDAGAYQEDEPFIPMSSLSTAENPLPKRQNQWSNAKSRLTNQDKRLKSIIISCLSNDVMKSVIKWNIAKEIWNNLILASEGPSDTRDAKIAALRLKFNAFKLLEAMLAIPWTPIGGLNMEYDLRVQMDDWEFVRDQGLRLKAKDAPPRIEASLRCYK
nr:retrovirus-related Pol polyprotein from transposon TNT 1-94 [Tanacetum cinerariifolium]